MKKVLSLVLIVVMCLFALTSCGLIDKITGWFNPTTTTTTTPPTPATTAENARDYLSTLYNGYLDNNKTAANFDVLSSFSFGGGTVTVAWTSTNDQITFVPKEGAEDTTLVVTLPERGENDIEYTLTGVVTAADGTTAQLSYDLVVPKMALTTYDEYVAAKTGDLITAEGVVVGICSKATGSGSNSIYFQNADGGFYAYNLDEEQMTGVEVGMTVRVSGTKDTYNGTYEIMSGKVTIVSTEKTAVTPADYTEFLKNAADLGDANLVGKQAFLVTIKGVTIMEADESNGYYYFQLGEQKVYLRISSSNNPCTKEDLEAIKAAHAANFGNTCDVTGLVSIYSSKFYLSPVSADAFNNFTVVEKTPAEKVATEKENFSITNSYNASGSYTLPVCGKNYSDVAVSWVSGSELIVIGENGAITVTVPDTKTTVTLTATFTCGESTETKEFEVTLNKTVISVSDALEIAKAQDSNGYTADKYLVGGIITSIKSDVFGNMTISDGVNELYVYGVYSTDGANKFETLDPKPAVGDYIVLLGVLGQYNGSTQLKSGWLVSFASPTSIPDANTAAEAAGSSYSENKYLVSGTVSSIVSETYGNMYIKDADGNEFYIYGLYDLAGTRYDGLTTKPAVGDVVVLYGVLGQYTNKSNVTTNQMKNATLVSLVQGEKEPEIPVEDGKVTYYFTLKETSVEIPEWARLFFVGSVVGWNNGADVPYFTNLEGTNIWYLVSDKIPDGDFEYKILVGLESGHGWENTWESDEVSGNAKCGYEAGTQLIDLGSHGFTTAPSDPTKTTYSIIGNIGGANWNTDFDLTATDDANVYTSGVITLAKDNEFKIRINHKWGDDFGVGDEKKQNVKVEADGKYIVTVNVEEKTITLTPYTEAGGDETPSTSNTITYDFKDLKANLDNYNPMTDGELLAAFNAATTDTSLTSATGVKIFAGNNSTSGSYAKENGYIKTGTGSVNGELTLTYAEGTKIVKVEIYCQGWKEGSKDTVSVNGSDAQTAGDTELQCLTFELSEGTNVLNVVFAKRVFISKIIITVE